MTSKTKSASRKVIKKIPKIDQVLGKLDQVYQRLDKVDQRLDKVDQRLDEMNSDFTAFTRYVVDEFHQVRQDISEFKRDISAKVDGFVGNVEKLNSEHVLVGHTLDRHETMLKMVNKKVELPHLN